MNRVICVIIGYAVGCIQTAYILGKIIGKIDIRKYGSGNAGTTNVVRVLGPKAGLLVFICDILKGMAAFLLCALIFKEGIPYDGELVYKGAYFGGRLGIIPGLYGGIGAVLGHNFPAHLKFKGGKGIAASIGIVFWLNWQVALYCYGAAVVAIVLSRYISLGSLVFIGLLPFLLYLFCYNGEVVVLGLILAVMAFYQHRGNIERLIKGCERKFNFKKETDSIY